MTAPVHESVKTATVATGGATSIACDKPVGTLEGDLLLAVVSARDNTASQSLTSPSGWTEIDQVVFGSIISGVWYKIAGVSEPSSYTWTILDIGGQSEFASIAISRISGTDGTTPINVWSKDTNATNTCPSITTTVDNCLLLTLLTNNGGGSGRDFDPPSGYTEQWAIDSAGSGAEGQDGASKTGGAAGATGTADFSVILGSAINTVNWHIAIAPAEGGNNSVSNVIDGKLIRGGILLKGLVR